MYFDLPLEELKTYLPPRIEPPDFDEFWKVTLAEARNFALEPTFNSADFGLRTVEAFDVTFNGFGGQAIKGWLLLPRQRPTRLPCIVEYIGYGGGRGFPIDWLLWSSLGYAHLVMDTRGQGSSWRTGDTPDILSGDLNPHAPGFMTRGVLDPRTYYYRRLMVDAVHAVEAARSHPAVDGDRITVTGTSQGGGLTIAVVGLDPQVSVAMPDVPFLCHYRRAVEITNSAPYAEITRYCQVHRDKIETVFNTLAYFDGVHFATRARARALFSVGLMDETCPPSTVFAAYNYYAGPKQIRVWSYNDHEGGESHQALEQARFLAELWR